MHSTERMARGLLRANEHWELGPDQRRGQAVAFTIAVSRECGTFGAAVAREVAIRLGWPVYDSELLQHIADDLGVHRKLLESIDERNTSWVGDLLENFSSENKVNASVFLHRLVQAILSLAKHGNCVIVGRGATKLLPLATTLRVRFVAPLEYRIEAVEREQNISKHEAAARVEKVDRERNQFVVRHFGMDPTDPANFDLVLNSARFSQQECTDLILAALDRLHKNAAKDVPVKSAS